MSHRVELEREDYEALCELAARATDPDRERIEFVRRAAIAFRSTRADWLESECVREAADLWDALQKVGC